jgi:hypothetical protein
VKPIAGEIDAWMEVAKFMLAVPLLFKWLSGKNENTDDDTVSECHDYVLDSLSDADRIRTINTITDKDLRDQLTIEQVQKLHDERELRRWRNRN